MWIGELNTQQRISIPGLSNAKVIGIEFYTNHGSKGTDICVAICPGGDGSKHVSCSARSVYTNQGICAYGADITIEGDSLTMYDASFSIYSSEGLGKSLNLIAGDSAKVRRIYAL